MGDTTTLNGQYQIFPSNGCITIVFCDRKNQPLASIAKYAYIYNHLSEPTRSGIAAHAVAAANGNIDIYVQTFSDELFNASLSMDPTIEIKCPCCGNALTVLDNIGYCTNLDCTHFDLVGSIKSKLAVIDNQFDNPLLIANIIAIMFGNVNIADQRSNSILSIIRELCINPAFGHDIALFKDSLSRLSIYQLLKLFGIPDILEDDVYDTFDLAPNNQDFNSILGTNICNPLYSKILIKYLYITTAVNMIPISVLSYLKSTCIIR